MKKFGFFICVLSIYLPSIKKSMAQQDAMYSHYMFNTLAVNPAYAGSREALSATLLHRSQWVNFDGAPRTQTFSIHAPIAEKRIGVGFSLVNDKIGPANFTSLFADFSYTLNLTETQKLAFGLKGGGSIRSVKLAPLKIVQENDPFFQADLSTKFLPNFGFGLYYYNPKLYAGISTPNLLQNTITNSVNTISTNLINEQRHYFLILGSEFDIKTLWKFRPTALLKATGGARPELDLTTMFSYTNKFHLGVMYRTGDALGALLGYNLTDQAYLGYSFDWSLANRTGQYNGGSHEVILRYDFVYKEKSVKSPRFF